MHRTTASWWVGIVGLLVASQVGGSCAAHPQSSPPPERDLTVQMVPYDLITNMPSDVPIVITLTNHQPWASIEEFVREELPSWHESVRAVRWPSREPVEGRWVFSNSYPLTLTFEPSAPLGRGWYAVQANFGSIAVPRGTAGEEAVRRGGTNWTWDDGWTTSRFHVGSLPIIQLWGGISPAEEGRDSGGSFSLFTTEPVVLEQDLPIDGLLTVTLDGEPVDCRIPGAEPGYVARPTGFPLQSPTWVCSEVPRAGHVVVTLRPLEGAPMSLRYGGRGNPPTWTGETSQPFSSRDVDDSIFAEEVRP